MTGSNLVLIVVPIVMLVALGAWLALVYYAGEHPEWKAHRLAREAEARAAAAGAAEERAAATAARQAAVPAGARAGGSPQPAAPHAA